MDGAIWLGPSGHSAVSIRWSRRATAAVRGFSAGGTPSISAFDDSSLPLQKRQRPRSPYIFSMTSFLYLAFVLALAPHAAAGHPEPSSPTVVRRWDAIGHRAMAAMAYDRLRQPTRARVNALLRQHPDLESLTEGIDAQTPAGVRELFIRASVWPDRIRSDARFYRETSREATPTPLLDGFPTMARREGWHYLTRSFSDDGTPTIMLTAPNVSTELPKMADALADNAIPGSVRAYHLGWIIHIVGDLHQPLHGTSRSSAFSPYGDAGGNGVWTTIPGSDRDSTNLHAVWDGMVGRVSRDLPLDVLAQSLANALPISAMESDDLVIPDGAALAATVKSWADESATLARYVAYDLPPREGKAPPVLSDGYLSRGEAIARHRLALAAYRLAALLEARLGDA